MRQKLRYGLMGAAFGAAFPVVATSIDLWAHDLPFDLAHAAQLQLGQPLHWVIDTAPIFLGLFAGLAGWREDIIITQQRETQGLVNSLQSLFESMPIGIAAYDSDDELISSNRAFSAFVSDDITVARKLSRLTGGFDPDEHTRQITLKSEENIKHALVGRVVIEGLGEEQYWLLVADLTQQKVNEEQLYQASKLATLGELATGTAHELNQPLSHIALLSQNLKRQARTGPVKTEVIEEKLSAIERSVGRAGKIVNHMRTFGRNEPAKFTPTLVNEVIQNALILLEHRVKSSNIAIEEIYGPGPLLIKAVDHQLEQVFINLIGNALDAITATDPAEKHIKIEAIKKDDTLTISITDTGGGMSDDELKKVFEPFYTTKAVGQGTGLGGSISYGIVRSFDGTIEAGNWEKGARFVMTFPAASDFPDIALSPESPKV